MDETDFEWNDAKDRINQQKHGVSFEQAQYAFLDDMRVIAKDITHSTKEERFYCFGLDREKAAVLTVRFTYREGKIRIIGAGYWRKGRRVYEQVNSIS